jgi:nucleotide-binding universal stress UspA family protein
MSVFDNILVPLDLTENSLPALKKALELGTDQSADVTCFHVIPESGDEAKSFENFYDEEASNEKLMGNYAIPWIKNWLTENDISFSNDIELDASMGNAKEKILEEVEQNEYDLIVMGTHGREGLKRYWTGSVAESVIREATCPVLTVRPEFPDITEE